MLSDKELHAKIQALGLNEKAALCSGLDAWQTKPNPAKGIPPLRMADGPHGVRVEDHKNRRQNGGASKPATCFPPEVTLAGSWDPGLTGRVGEAIAEECLHYGVGLILGPGINIKRSPLCGRNFEYYSEDPLLAGKLAAGFINGVQDRGVGTSLKHYAVNSQEAYRMSISAALDDRALFDIYLKAFEIAVKEAQPATVMASYNRVNGTYATENRRLLTDILRLQFGFSGVVVSDWGAVYDRPMGLAAGCDLEMPASGGLNDEAIVRAVREGRLSEDALDAACWNLLRLIFTYSREGREVPAVNWAAHHALAEEALCKSAVLLKNDDAEDGAPMLPLAKEAGRIAVIGEMADKPRYQGGGSSVINPKKMTGFLGALKAAGQSFVYAPGHAGQKTTEGMLAAAVAAAKACRRVVLFAGLPDAFECEGYDREGLDLPACQQRLIAEVAAANPNVTVVLCCGGPVAMPWLSKVKAVLCLHLGGQALGGAAVRLLFGDENPAGKLAETWPLALEDTPSHAHFPMGPDEVTYNESVYVGYRYYNTAGVPVQFPFGYGLSYTKFAYSALKLSAETLKEGGSLTASFTVKNTGGRDGEEIVQLYLHRKDSAAFQPKQELVGFARVALAAGKQQTVKIELPYEALGYYDLASATRVVEAGSYQLQVGANSRDIRLTADFAAEGVQPAPPAIASAAGPYAAPVNNDFGDEAFAELYTGGQGKAARKPPLLGNRRPARGEYTPLTPLGLMGDSLGGRFLLGAARVVARATLHFSQDKEANRKAVLTTTHDLPFKNLVLNTGGRLRSQASAALLDACNGKGGVARFLGALLGGR